MLRNKELNNSKRRDIIIVIFQLFHTTKQILKWDFTPSEAEEKSNVDVTSVLQASTAFRLQESGICTILEEMKISL